MPEPVEIYSAEWVRTSLLIGVLCGQVERYSPVLGREFIGRARKPGMDMTPAVLAQFRREALEAGVPEAVLVVPDEIEALLNDPDFIRFAIGVQITWSRIVGGHGKVRR